MCGITGVATHQGLDTKKAVLAAVNLLVHRGPDHTGFFHWSDQNKGLSLAQTRFSIIDLSPAANQPMTNEDGSLRLVCNGEIYNYRKLKRDLVSRGHRFCSASDNEVILHLYEEKKENLLADLEGMFAFAIWDEKRKSLFLARDHLGIKPLYYSWNGSTLVFGSEVRAVIGSGLVKRKIDRQSISFFLKFGSVPAPRTIYEQVKCLKPGHYLVFNDQGLKKIKYWDVSALFEQDKLDFSEEEAVALVRKELGRSLRKHLIADVPLGIFLSGGVDSSSLVSVARKVMETDLNTLSVVFPGTGYDESKFARKVVEKYKTKHREIEISSSELNVLVGKFLEAMDQPTIDGLNTYLVSLAAQRAGLKVCLSGLGGDELFGGYPSFWRLPLIYNFLRSLGPAKKAFQCLGVFGWSKLDRLVDGLEPFSLENLYLNYRAVFSNKEISLLVGEENKIDFVGCLSQDVCKIRDIREKISVLELSCYMANQLLRDSDVFSMVHPVEVRVPFVDREFIRVLARVPAKYKYQRKPNKAFLVKTVADLPAEVYQRPKKGFTLPLDLWMRNELKERVEGVLADNKVFNQSFVREMMNGFYANRVHWSKPWSLFILSQWLK